MSLSNLVDFFNKKLGVTANPVPTRTSYDNKTQQNDTTYKKPTTMDPIDMLPDPKDHIQINEKAMHDTNFDGIPRFVDRKIRLPVKKLSPDYQAVKDLIMMHMEYAKQEIDYSKVEFAKDHVEAAVYYLRNVLN